MSVRVPGSSANLGPGFDALALAVSSHVTVGVAGTDAAPERAQECDDRHPSQIAFVRAGGRGRLWIENSIPMGRGMGFSGAARIAGLVAAKAQDSPDATPDGWAVTSADAAAEVLRIGSELEGHADNVAASLAGGIVATAAGRVVRIGTPLDPTLVLWVPSYTTSTSESRTALGDRVAFADAVFNIGRTALLVAALASGDLASLRDATADALHQNQRLAKVPLSREALECGLAAGAWCGWLSGSGPTVAFMCDAGAAGALGAALPPDGDVKVLGIDPKGAVVL